MKKIIGYTLALIFIIGFPILLNYASETWWVGPLVYATAAALIGMIYLIMWLLDD